MNIIKHSFEPIYNNKSKILILGSFPSVLSRENNFYYGNTQNRFWKVLSILTDSTLPSSKADKISLLLKYNIALWDVVESCSIIGSSDNSISNVIPVDLSIIMNHANIEKIFVNGSMADKLYKKYCYSYTGINAVKLPSTSPANATYTLERLLENWQQVIY